MLNAQLGCRYVPKVSVQTEGVLVTTPSSPFLSFTNLDEQSDIVTDNNRDESMSIPVLRINNNKF